jgi:O-antigen ligase
MNFFLVYSRKEAWIRVSILSAFLALPLGLAIAKSPDLLLRATSTRGHWDRPLEAIQTIIQHPLGLGLGSAGPASNRVSDACVFLEAESDASWARDRGELCVFVGGTQMQPLNRTCRCPLLPENWYLQIGVELGVLGFLLYLTLTIMIFRALLSIVRSGVHPSPLLHAAFLAFFGISIAALFLHAWEDSALAYSLWMLVGMALPAHRQNLSTA